MFTPRLRGNTFIVLLLRAAVNELSERPEWGESHNGITRCNLFADLLRLINPSYSPLKEKTLSSYFSKYLKGELQSSPKYFPFDSLFYQTGLQMRINEEYPTVLTEMDAFYQKYLQKTDGVLRNLVGGIVETILEDETFVGSFDVGERWVNKTELAEVKEFSLQPFLVSVWNTIVSNYHDVREGAETYRKWTKHINNTPDTITTCIGRETAMRIKVSVVLPETPSLEDSEPDLGIKKGPTEKTAEPQVIEVEEEKDSPRIEKYEALYTDPFTGRQVLGQFHIEARDHSIAAGIFSGTVNMGSQGDKDD